MPGDTLAIAGHLAEEMRAPGDHVFAEQIRHARDDARVGQDIENTAVAEMRCADGIAIPAGSQRAGKQIVEVAANAGDLIFLENPYAFEEPLAIEIRNLTRRQA